VFFVISNVLDLRWSAGLAQKKTGAGGKNKKETTQEGEKGNPTEKNKKSRLAHALEFCIYAEPGLLDLFDPVK